MRKGERWTRFRAASWYEVFLGVNYAYSRNAPYPFLRCSVWNAASRQMVEGGAGGASLACYLCWHSGSGICDG